MRRMKKTKRKKRRKRRKRRKRKARVQGRMQRQSVAQGPQASSAAVLARQESRSSCFKSFACLQ